MTNRAKRKADSRQQIMDAAALCFMRHGLEKATMDDIADELNSTKGRVYHHFRSKNAIFFAVYRQAMEYCFEGIGPILNEPLPPDEKLRRMTTAHALVMMETLPYQRSIRIGVEIYLRGRTTAQEREMLAELIGLRREYEDLFRTVLKQGVETGVLAVHDVPLAGRAIIGALNGLVDWYRARPEQTRADRVWMAETLTETIVGGVLA